MANSVNLVGGKLLGEADNALHAPLKTIENFLLGEENNTNVWQPLLDELGQIPENRSIDAETINDM